MAIDRYERGKPLTKEGLFQLVSDEVFRDGVVESHESQILQRLARFLGFDLDTARSVAATSAEKFRSGQLAESRPFDSSEVYKRIVSYVQSGGDADRLTEKMLQGIRMLLKIPDDVHDRLMKDTSLGSAWSRPLPAVGVVPLESTAPVEPSKPNSDPPSEKSAPKRTVSQLVSASRPHFELALAGKIDVASIDAAARMTAELTVALRDEPGASVFEGLQALANLTPTLMAGDFVEFWRVAIEVALYGVPLDSNEPLSNMAECCVNNAIAALAKIENPELHGKLVAAVTQLAVDLPEDICRWIALSKVCGGAAEMYRKLGRPDLAAEFLVCWKATPPRARSVCAGTWAEALMDAGIATVVSGDAAAVPVRQTLSELRTSYPSLYADASLAGILAYSLDSFCQGKHKDKMQALTDSIQLVELVKCAAAERRIVRIFAQASSDLLRVWQYASRNRELLELLQDYSRLAKRYAKDDAIVFPLLKSVVNASLVRIGGHERGLGGPATQAERRTDEVMLALGKAMRFLMEACADRSLAEDARGRFERGTGLSL